MTWKDLGLILKVDKRAGWATSHAYVPTALVMDDRIRVYIACLDDRAVGRLGFADLDLEDPRKVIGFSAEPILADAPRGSFDADGVTPMALVRDRGRIRLYYAGWKRLVGDQARYTLFTGIAVSENGDVFERLQDTPVIGPNSPDCLVRTAGVVLNDNGVWRCWYADFVCLLEMNGKSVPAYRLATMESQDGVVWPNEGIEVFSTSNDIFGFGRSAIWKHDGNYHGLFSIRRRSVGYQSIEHSVSRDGCVWSAPTSVNMSFPAASTCDGQEQVCFPNAVVASGRRILFYNGNAFGRDGLRAAIWHDEE
jgi:hypothetical protein